MTVEEACAKLVELYREDPFALDDFVVEEGKWEQDGKYQLADDIVEYEGHFFIVSKSRSGSYHTDWYYGDTTISLVERKEKTVVVTAWEQVGDCLATIAGE